MSQGITDRRTVNVFDARNHIAHFSLHVMSVAVRLV